MKKSIVKAGTVLTVRREKIKAGWLCLLCFLLLGFYLPVKANNIQLNGVVSVKEVNSGVATLEFTLDWDNSWRDSYNWDAVWLFLKYKSGAEWKHLMLEENGHSFVSRESDGLTFTYMAGKTNTDVVGLFVMLDKIINGNCRVTCQVKCKLPDGLTKDDFDNANAFLMAQGIEMVYVPYGAYMLGDGSSNRSFVSSSGESYAIDSEVARQLNVKNGTSINIANGFPQGYQGFYVMKYEVSQEQYVTFLNTLTSAQQTALLPDLNKLDKGHYVFGDSLVPNCRNGIIVSQKLDGEPVVFDNNLTQDNAYGNDDDGKAVACNYLSVNDLIAYASWSGLRPMTEMEYEKACRRPYPMEPIAKEYAWNSTGLILISGSLNNENTLAEYPTSGNVNAGQVLNGPVRCGAFAAYSTMNGLLTQNAAGATYWGVMEMSGNLKELCSLVTNTAITRDANGDGTYVTGKWGPDRDFYGLRGGGFNSPDSCLSTADRSEIDYLSSLVQRDSAVGFRCARTLDATTATVEAGTIGGDSVACPGGTVEIKSLVNASVTGVADMPVSYVWYVNGVPQSETGATLTYSGFEKFKSYTFQRKAICAVGEKLSNQFVINTISVDFALSDTVIRLDRFDNTDGKFIATPQNAGGTFKWYYGGDMLTHGVAVQDSLGVYEPRKANFGTDVSSFQVFRVSCQFEYGKCKSDMQVVRVDYTSDTLFICGKNYVDPRDNQVYPTVSPAGSNQCWMAKNLNYGTLVVGSTYNTHMIAGVQKLCYSDNESNCSTYGALYRWEEAVNGENVSAASDQPNYNYVSGSSGDVEGVCPRGWHVPSDEEWKVLELSLGMTQAQVDATGWRGSDQGRKLKSVNLWTSNSATTGTNTSGMDMLPGGYRYISGGTFHYLGTRGNWWSSTPNDGSTAWRRSLGYTEARVLRITYNKSYGFSVRCVRNTK